MSHQRIATALLLVLSFALVALPGAGAQERPATPAPGSAPVGTLAAFAIDALPTPHAEVWFLRMGLAPAGRLPLSKQLGPTVLYLESGQLSVSTDEPVSDGKAHATPGAPGGEQTAGLYERVLSPGQAVLIREGTTVTATNPGDAPASFLVLLMFSAEREGEGDDAMEEPVGLAQQGIAVGTAEFLPVPASVTIERVVIAPGDTMATAAPGAAGMGPGWMGIELGAVEGGSAEVTFTQRSHQNLIWPAMAEGGMIAPELVALTATKSLTPGDGYAAFSATLAWTATGEEPLTVLRAVVTPHLP